MLIFKKGLVVNILYGIVCCAHQSNPERTTQELLDELFDGVDHSFYQATKHIRFIDHQTFLEEYELGEQFRSLTPAEKEQFIETIELLNTLYAEIVSSFIEK